MKKDLVQESENYKKIADELLADSEILSQLQNYGVVETTGSYAYNLMLAPDIDIVVNSKPNNKEKAIRLLNQLIDNDWWNLFTFADWYQEKFRISKWQWLPKGYYIRVKADYNGYRWNIDIWLVDNLEYQKRKDFDTEMSKIDSRQKKIILNLKNVRNQEKLNISSVDIYEAVTKHNIATIDDLNNWVAKEKV